jgi:hypothetical protein
MSAKKVNSSGWPVKAVAPPLLTTRQWAAAAVPGLVLLAAAITQLVSFTDFGFRLVSNALAVAAGLFWFVESLQLVANDVGAQLNNSGYFGRFLAQSPGWWTVVESTLLLLWIVYEVGIMRDNTPTTRAGRE